MTNWPELAREITEDVLIPTADSVDADGEIPLIHFAAVASPHVSRGCNITASSRDWRRARIMSCATSIGMA